MKRVVLLVLVFIALLFSCNTKKEDFLRQNSTISKIQNNKEIQKDTYISAVPFIFPSELQWWIDEIQTKNHNINTNSFIFRDTISINIDKDIGNLNEMWFKVHPIFMQWNLSGDYLAYNTFAEPELTLQESGRYLVHSFDENDVLLLTDKEQNIFFYDYFSIRQGLHSTHWLTDELLIGVGIDYIDEYVDLFIKYYRINVKNNTVEISTYVKELALQNDDRLLLKLNWFEHKSDYFELDKSK